MSTHSPNVSQTANPRMLRLQGVVQHYSWGGYDFIPALIGQSNPDRQPFAELWIGSHPKAPSRAWIDGAEVPLDRVPGGRVPYLLKVLDARQMLSIQAHPNRAQAEAGFARENAAHIPLDDPRRNYRDANHKPEVHVALTEFWMLHGFRPLEDIARVLRQTPELGRALPTFQRDAAELPQLETERREWLRALYRAVMTMPQSAVDTILNPLIARLERTGRLDKDTPDYWALRAARDFPMPNGHRDRGILSIYLLNLVRLRPGEGTYQPAGTLHAYLEGVNVELMANSDNVLRGGLTSKHVDAQELLRTLSFDSGAPVVLAGRPVSDTEAVYRTAAQEFELSRIEVRPGQECRAGAVHGPDTLLVMEGAGSAECNGETLRLQRGDILFVPTGLAYSLRADGERWVVFRASVPARG